MLLMCGEHSGDPVVKPKKRGLPKEHLQEIDELLQVYRGQPKHVQNLLILKYWDGEASTKERFDLYNKIRARAKTKKSHKSARYDGRKVRFSPFKFLHTFA